MTVARSVETRPKVTARVSLVETGNQALVRKLETRLYGLRIFIDSVVLSMSCL